MDNGLYRTIPLACVILSFATVAMLWTELPDTIPLHFDVTGEPEAYASKWLLWILPLLNLGVFYLLAKAANPAWQKYSAPLVEVTEENAVRQQTITLQLLAQLRIIICLILAYLAYTSAQIGGGLGKGLSIPILLTLVSLMFSVVAIHAYRQIKAK